MKVISGPDDVAYVTDKDMKRLVDPAKGDEPFSIGAGS